MRLIDADTIVGHIVELFNEECIEEISISELLDKCTEEGCPKPVTLAQAWIPVTERLPKEDGRYLVCGAKGGIYHANYRGRWWTQVGCGGKLVPSVVAWMPLPKPWEGETE